MATILNYAMLDSAILHKTLTQTSSIWLKLIHSHSTWWWHPSWILQCWIQPFCTKLLTQTSSIWLKLIHCHSPWWWQPSWILLCWIHPFCTKLWLKLVQSDSNSFILTQLDDGSHLEFCHYGFSYFAQKKTSLIHLTQLYDGSHLEFCHLGFRHCHLGFKRPCYLLSDSLKNTLPQLWPWLKLIKYD